MGDRRIADGSARDDAARGADEARDRRARHIHDRSDRRRAACQALGNAGPGAHGHAAFDLGEHPERVRLRRAALGRGLGEPRVGDDGVLVLAEHVLDAGERDRELAGAADRSPGAASSAAYRHRLARMRTSCSAASDGTVREVVDRATQPPPRGPHRAGQRVDRERRARSR